MAKKAKTNRKAKMTSKGFFLRRRIFKYPKLTINEKLILCYMCSFFDNQNTTGKFFASNGHIAAYFGISISTASNVVTSLQKKGLIELEHFDGTKRILVKTGELTCLIEEDRRIRNFNM